MYSVDLAYLSHVPSAQTQPNASTKAPLFPAPRTDHPKPKFSRPSVRAPRLVAPTLTLTLTQRADAGADAGAGATAVSQPASHARHAGELRYAWANLCKPPSPHPPTHLTYCPSARHAPQHSQPACSAGKRQRQRRRRDQGSGSGLESNRATEQRSNRATEQAKSQGSNQGPDYRERNGAIAQPIPSFTSRSLAR